MRHQVAELVGQLRGERLVVREHQGGPLHLLDEPGGGRRLAGSGRAEQHDIGLAGVDAAREVGDRLRLITRRHVLADDLEGPHGSCRLHLSRVGAASDIAVGVRRRRTPAMADARAAAMRTNARS